MQFLKKTKLSIFFTLLLFSGCQDSVNEFTPISNKAEVQTPSLQLSKENLLAAITTTEFTEQLPEYLGEFKVSQNILFDNFSGHHIGITPFNKDSKVLGLVLSSKKESNWRHVLIEKNKLAEYYNQPQESLTPSSSMIRKLFDVLSERSQSMSSMSNHSLNQASSNNIASRRSLESLSYDAKNEWVENCEWYESFRYTGDDGIIYYSEYSLHCYWEYQWESSPGTVIIDAGGSGGGGFGGGSSEFRNCAGSIVCFPLVKYPLGSDYASKYPKLTEYLKNQLPKIASNETIIASIKKYTGLSEAAIKKQLYWGEGPEIKIEQLDKFCATCSPDTYGIFDGNKNPNTIYIDSDLVMDLENSIAGTGIADSFAFLVGVTLLHELVHLGDWTDGMDYPGEEGHLFERDVYGQSVWRNNAQAILRKGN